MQFAPLEHLKYGKLQVPLAIGSGLVLAVLMGLLIGSADFTNVKRTGLMLLVVVYILFWQPHTWKTALAICCFGFSYVGFGFRVGVIEISGIVAALLISVTWWRKQRIARPEIMELFSFRVFNLTLLAWLLYSGGHAVYTVMDPFNPAEFSLKNFLKTLVSTTGPLLLLFYFIHRPRGIVATENMPRAVLLIGFAALLVNTILRAWGLTTGAYDPNVVSEDAGEGGVFAIAALDLIENPYALRGLTPITATTAAVVIGSDWLKRRSMTLRVCTYALLVLSFLGALLSGGRAAIIFVFVLSSVALVMRGHYRAVLLSLLAGILVFIAVNLVPGVLRNVPPLLQRSLQMVVFTDESDYARMDIRGSTEWRIELVKRAFAEWRSDKRIFWFGRGTYRFGSEDAIALRRNAAQGALEISLRRGSTHSLITDLLVVHGLVGLVVYFAMITTLLRFLWHVYKHPSSDEVVRMITLICLLLLSFINAYGVFGGGANFPIEVAWLLIALFGYVSHQARRGPPTADHRELRRAQHLRPPTVQRRLSGTPRRRFAPHSSDIH